ncbi:hypothetical protein AB0I72_19655 [Nocardiopsis sp. NPDC049922]|uniref:hypothetical protein n=1 Tax=Nocardiopsis sp. NPDC049922 TaxID=3155157 RepID=UPI0033E8C5C3
MSSDTSPPPERIALGKHIDERAAEKGMTLSEVAKRARRGTEALRRIRKGEVSIPMATRRALEDALEWTPGSINSILAGGRPMPLEEAAPQAYVTSTPQGGLQLWLSVRGADGHPQQMMIPLDLKSVPGLDGLAADERDSLTHQMLGVMVHAGRSFLEEQGRQRAERTSESDPTGE